METTTGQTVGRETVGKGADSGTGNSRDKTKTPYDGMVDGGNRNQRRGGSGNLVGNEKSRGFPFPSRSVLVPTTFSRPDVYCAYPSASLTRVTKSYRLRIPLQYTGTTVYCYKA